MNLDIEVAGGIVERQELLNGTRTAAFEGASADSAWTVSGVVSWNLGLLEYAGEGDLTLARDDGSELYATLVRAEASGGESETVAEVLLATHYEIDGGAGAYKGASGAIQGEIRITEGAFDGHFAFELP